MTQDDSISLPLEEYLHLYEFQDRHEIYTNGAMLVPSFRIENWARSHRQISCRECVHYNPQGCAPGFGWCEIYQNGRVDDGFCECASVKMTDECKQK